MPGDQSVAPCSTVNSYPSVVSGVDDVPVRDTVVNERGEPVRHSLEHGHVPERRVFHPFGSLEPVALALHLHRGSSEPSSRTYQAATPWFSSWILMTLCASSSGSPSNSIGTASSWLLCSVRIAQAPWSE